MRALTLALLAATLCGCEAAPDADAWGREPGAFLAAVVLGAVAAVLALSALVALLGTVAPGVRRATDRHARGASPGWTTVVGALVGFGVLAILGGASKAGPTAGAIAALALGLPAALLGTAGLLATLPLLGERLLGRRGEAASPLATHLVGAAVAVAALGGAAAVGLVAVALAVLVGWPVGVGVGALVSSLRRARPPA